MRVTRSACSKSSSACTPKTPSAGGSGAGLTIARKMVEQHRGRLWFDSLPGAGSTFYFTLPGPKTLDLKPHAD